jgi:hypothetical protein
MKIFLSNEITKERTKKFEKIKDSTLIDGFRISWFTAVGSIGKSKIFLYKPTITFADQIKDQQIFDNSFGLAWNTYFKSGLQNQTWLINLGVLRSLGNNSDTLSTTDVLEEYSYKNAKGDTTRKVSQKYSAYSDEIFHKREVITYLNVYYIFGQNSNGLHFFSTYFKPDKKTGYYSTGVGYLLSFKPQKKELPLINTETYFTANDLFGSQTSKKLLGRGEIGIRFTFPFNLL